MNKKIPERKCLGCAERRPKNELIRVVRTPKGEILIDRTGKRSGRGAYLCPELACFNKARKAKRFESALEVEIPAEIYEKLAATLAAESEDADEENV